ncbi:MAG: YecA family protein, partial [Mesorhizobium sp.]
MSAIDDMALSDEALEAWMTVKANPRPLVRT